MENFLLSQLLQVSTLLLFIIFGVIAIWVYTKVKLKKFNWVADILLCFVLFSLILVYSVNL